MSRSAKIILGIGGGIILLCLCACVSTVVLLPMAGSFLIVEDPEEVAAIGHKIVDYEVPAGYEEEFGMDFFGFFSLAAISSGDLTEATAILMMQFPQFANMDQAAMEQQMQQAVQQQLGSKGEMQLEVVDQTSATIRDQEVILTVREGVDDNGNALRQVVGVFQGKEGPTMLMIFGPPNKWDQTAIDSFIESMQ